ncbi:uncharacterized protein LOC143857091 [Tasmannia lanceolata]|uniref:uncharacterized protein LOC143857091 n=1 Tax=Tasmannia lanceolata TaxID=3420 RepID=UPI004062C0CC
MARNCFKESGMHKVRIRLIGNRESTSRQYNMPTATEVAALIVGDLNDTNVESDVIIEHKRDGLKRISDLHPSFMAIQYPVLFPYGEDGFYLGIPYKSNNERRQTKRLCVTMREYYAFRIQQRQNESESLIRGGRLFQQFLVDAYTTIEEDRLRWIRNHQPRLRAELYKGLRDAVVRGDTTPASVGRRIVLPSSFTGGIYGAELSRCNDYIVIAAINAIEFQKRGLAHAHILLWLHQSDKYPTPYDIDKIISAEIPDVKNDVAAYAVVLNRENVETTMFTQWMQTNAVSKDAQNLTFAEFPTRFVWNQKDKIWQPRKKGKCIGRIFYAHPTSGERLLDGDKEWHDAINEASHWANAAQLRELFATLLLFCEISNPLELWERNWRRLSDDILYRQRKALEYAELQLNDYQIENYTLFDIESILVRSGKSLKDFKPLPLPGVALLKQLKNQLIREETLYDKEQLRTEHTKLLGGTGKTYVYRTIIARLRSEGRIVLAVASSGIAALILEGGRTAHSRFEILLNLLENSTCGIKQGTQLADLIKQASLIICDEAPMYHRHAFEAVDRSLKDILRFDDPTSSEKPFGGKTILLGGDFRHILPVVPKGGSQDTVLASVNNSYLLVQYKGGDNPIGEIVSSTYPSFHNSYKDPQYLQERVILAPKNHSVDDTNSHTLQIVPGQEHTYLSSDSICKASSNVADQNMLYPVEFLNTLQFPGLLNHKLHMKIGVPIMEFL